MEALFSVSTAFGEVWLRGRDTGRPLVVVVTGISAAESTFDGLQADLGAFDVLRTHLPGNHCPGLSESSIQIAGMALDEALRSRFLGRRTLLIGLSAGALVALTVKAAQVARLVLLEPFFRPEAVWPLRHIPSGAGILTERDYRGLLDGLSRPALVAVGDIPLGVERPVTGSPSYVSEDDRAALAAHPLVDLTIVPDAGHNLAAANPAAVFDIIRRGCLAMI